MPSIIVFSKDRPMQLHAYLESLFTFSDARVGDVSILFRPTPAIDYHKVIGAFPDVHWIQEQDFHSDLIGLIDDSEDYIMFGCDDVVFTGAFSLHFAKTILIENDDIFGFSFRLGDNIQPQPQSLFEGRGYRKWHWPDAKERHYSYPWELDCTMYRKSDVQKMLLAYGDHIQSPNYLEGNLAAHAKKYIARPHLACLNEKSKAIVITVNAVQDTHPNGFDDQKPTDIYSLEHLYNKKNNKLDIQAISEIKNHQIHVGSEYFVLENYDKNWERKFEHKSTLIKTNPLRLFIKNIGYLFKYDLKKIAKESITFDDLNPILDGMKYEVEDEIKNIKKPNIKNSTETIDAIIKDRASFCRFGDGEFSLIHGESIGFQKADVRLAKRLIEIIQSDDENILIGIPDCYYSSVEDLRDFPKRFIRTWVAHHRSQITSLTIPSKQYYDTACTQLYALYQVYDFRKYFTRIKEIWCGRDLTIICGKSVFTKIEVNIFDSAKSLEYQYAPSSNAFTVYEELFEQAMRIDKNRLIIIILGPTATVLAYDLAKQGYQALDFGHIAKDYDFYCKKVPHNSETIANFFKPD